MGSLAGDARCGTSALCSDGSADTAYRARSGASGAATACADISDGLLADLDHILTRSGVSAEIEWERIPLSPVLSTLTVARQHEAALAGGDDYELIFTAPPAAAERIFEAGLLSNTPVSRIGRILEREETAVVVRTADGLPVAVPSTGYDHSTRKIQNNGVCLAAAVQPREDSFALGRHV